MPTMPRFSKKGDKIAFDILGVPANLQKPSKKEMKRREYIESNVARTYGRYYGNYASSWQ